MSLQERKENFKEISKHCDKRICDLIASYNVPETLFHNLRLCVCLYMSKSALLDRYLTDPDEIIEYYTNNKDKVPTITPNGLIVPKKHSMMEFNLLSMAFYKIIETLGINVYSWNVPLSLRIKFGTISETAKRKRASEHAHSDAWVDEYTKGGTAMLPLMGDLENNNVLFYDPPEDFEEDWLSWSRMGNDYTNGTEIVDKYKVLDYKPKVGELVLSDYATIHASKIYKEGGARVSIDTIFGSIYGDEDISKIRWRGTRRTPEALKGLGRDSMLKFLDDVNDKVEVSGTKQPVNVVVEDI